jgi:hypothetical protein
MQTLIRELAKKAAAEQRARAIEKRAVPADPRKRERQPQRERAA